MDTPKKHARKKISQTTKELLESFSKPSYLDEPTKPIEVKKPINGFDYLSALVRIPEVQKDLKSLNKESTKEKTLEFIDKYFGVFKAYPTVLLNPGAFHRYKKYYPKSDAIHVFSNWEKGCPGIGFSDSLSKYRDGKHVILAVDITKKGIIKQFEKVLKRIKKDYNIQKDKTRDGETSDNIWEIYDYNTKDKLSLYKIAKRKDNSDYYKKRVLRAYDKAKKIMDAVKKDVEEAIRENEEMKKVSNEVQEKANRMAEESKKERTPTIVDRLLGRTPKK